MKKMNQSKLFLHTSFFESLGYVFQEALHCGCHVVSFKTGLIPESSQTHICNDVNEMISAIKNILENEKIFQQQKTILMGETVESLIGLYGMDDKIKQQKT